PPWLSGSAESAYYLCANRGKRSVTVDMAKPEGQALIKQLAAQSDVVLENFKVGGLKKYGLDYASLK
ncbi:MAG TPA: CoA transferase, partial [Halomonas sp.]|nr:CoA transferase [Halomonas sp.]